MRRTYALSGGPHCCSSAGIGTVGVPRAGRARRRALHLRGVAADCGAAEMKTCASRRFRLNAAGCPRASSAAMSCLPRVSSGASSATSTVMECAPPSSSPISPTTSPGPASPISRARSPGTRNVAARRPSTTTAISRASSPCRQRVSPSRASAVAPPLRARSGPPRPDPSKSGTVARNPTISRSDIQVTNVELEPLGGELGGQQRVLGHLEPGRMVGGERLRGDDDGAGHITSRSSASRRRARRTRHRLRTRGSRTGGLSRASRPPAGTSRSRTRIACTRPRVPC